MKAKINELGQEKVKLVKYHKQQLLDMSTAHDKALREQKAPHDLAAADASKENEKQQGQVL